MMLAVIKRTWLLAFFATSAFLCLGKINAFVPAGRKIGWYGGPLQTGNYRTLRYDEEHLLQLSFSMRTDESASSSSGDAPTDGANDPSVRQRPMGPPPRRPGNRNARGPQRGAPRRNGPPRGGPPGRVGQGEMGRPRQFTTIVLQNPMKVKRVVEEPRPGSRPSRPNRSDGDRSSNARTDFPSRTSSGPRFGTSVGQAGNDARNSNDSSVPAKKSKRLPQKKERVYDNKRGRTQLRVGSGKQRNSGSMNRRASLKRKDRSQRKESKLEKAIKRRTIRLPEGPMTVAQLSESLEEKPAVVIKFLMTDMGIMASMTQSIDGSTCIAVCEGLGKIVAGADDYDQDEEEDEDEDSVLETGFALDEDDPDDLIPRAPVVTIMGHVDHGKTSLLDAIRNTRVTAGEAGGITQHIGAYQVTHKGSPITFIDTPGHAAFSDMRARGANITDIVILVVAADDGVKQQTVDSIACARQAGVPIVIAVNKCDLETSDVNKVKSELAGYELLSEDLGGEILSSDISAKMGTNLDDLLSKVMLQAEILELTANPDRDAQGIIVEARVEKGLGVVATTLIQKGTLKVGDCFVSGETCGKVRALIGPDGKTRYDEAGPSTPISVVGFNAVPAAGDLMVVAENEQVARELAASRQRLTREKEALTYQSGLMESVVANFAGGVLKEKREMCVIVKADVQGSAEALSQSLSELKLEDEESIVTVKVLVSEAGDVTKTDIAIASVTPSTTVIAFNCAANMAAMDDARVMGVPIEYYNIVYDAIDSVESRMQEVLSPTPEGEYVGSATVQEVFNIGGTGNIAGSKCNDGYLRKGSNVRVMRGDKIMIESKVKTLRNFKSEVDQIDVGDECGIGLLDYEDFQAGDVIESYVDK